MKENLVSIVIPSEVVQTVLSAYQTIETALKEYLIALTPEERRTILKMGDRTLAFVGKVIEFAEANPNFVPPYMNLPELKNDYAAYESLHKMHTPLDQEVSKLSDTLLSAGNDCYRAALVFYNSVKTAAKNDVPGAKTLYDELKKRFEKSVTETKEEKTE